jgi:nucleotide-binding universal stress UspA family protein
MVLPHTILVAYDFSPGAGRALRQAVDLARVLPRTNLVLMHALEPIAPIMPEIMKSMELVTQRMWRDRIGPKLEALGRKTKLASRRPVRTVIRDGRAFREIVKAAKDVHANLIVMGSTGYSSRHASVFGSTTERVARDAPCPVLLVGGQRNGRR